MKVYKFGGTSVGTVERMKHVAELISESAPKIVVLSATAGTTNHLEEIAANLFSRDIEQAHEKITRLEFQFIDFANELLTDESIKREAIDYILDRFQRLWQFINNEFTSVEEKRYWRKGNLSVQPCSTSTCGNGRLPISCSLLSTLCVPERKGNRT